MKNRFYFATILLVTTLASAQENSFLDQETEKDTVKPKKYILEEVIVAGSHQNTPSVSKSNIKEMDLPQATSSISSDVLQKQQAKTLSDILKNANGVYIMGTSGGYQEEIASRGFSLRSDNTFKNGIRYYNGMMIETSGLEKIEFLKGSAAMLYGNVAPGGVLNLVTKKPKKNFGAAIGFAQGSFSTYKPTFDVYDGLGAKKNVAFRINGTYENAESYRNYVTSEKYYINPSFSFQLSEKTELLVEADYTNDSRTPDFGAGVINYKIVALPRNRFLGVSWGTYDAEQLSSTLTLTHKINEKWSVNFINGIRYYQTTLLANARPNTGGLISENGDWNRSIQKADSKDNYFTQQANLNGLIAIGKTKHNVLFGADVENFKNYATRYNNVSYDTINIFEDYNPDTETAIPDITKNRLTTTPISRFGIYVQDLVSLTERWKVLAGVRYSYQDTETNVLTYNNNTSTTTNNYDDAFSPRVGLIYQPTKNHTVFATYSNSFDVNTGADINNEPLKPSIIDQYEVGFKNKLFKEIIQANITFYQINNNNLAQNSLVDPNFKELAGSIRSEGVEIDIITKPFNGLQIVAGYSFNETKYVKSNTYVEGSLLRYNPKNTANLSANYSFEAGRLKGLNLGLINTYFGERYAGRSTQVRVANDTRQLIYLQDFFQVDATVGYQFKKATLRAKLSNVFNELSYNAHDDNSLNPIAPRNFSIALQYNL